MITDIDALWGHYDEASAALVHAKRAYREGRCTEEDLLRLRMELMEVAFHLSALGEHPDPTEPGG